ncbi:2-oxoglutarate dehydrogenase complex E2 component, partial [Podila epicladia]
MISTIRSKPIARLARPLTALSTRTLLSIPSQVVRRQLTINAAAAVAVTSQRVRYILPDYVVKVPHMADSISEGSLKQWNKKVGDYVALDEEIATIETDKVDVAVNSPKAGTIVELYAKEEDTVAVGADLFKLELGDAPAGGASELKREEPKKETPKKEEPKKEEPKKEAPAPKKEEPKKEAKAPTPAPKAVSEPSVPVAFSREERSVKMNRMRQTIAKRLKQSQENAASLTTFNEVDMSALMNMRNKYKDAVLKKHNVKLGFMSAFVKAS